MSCGTPREPTTRDRRGRQVPHGTGRARARRRSAGRGAELRSLPRQEQRLRGWERRGPDVRRWGRKGPPPPRSVLVSRESKRRDGPRGTVGGASASLEQRRGPRHAFERRRARCMWRGAAPSRRGHDVHGHAPEKNGRPAGPHEGGDGRAGGSHLRRFVMQVEGPLADATLRRRGTGPRGGPRLIGRGVYTRGGPAREGGSPANILGVVDYAVATIHRSSLPAVGGGHRAPGRRPGPRPPPRTATAPRRTSAVNATHLPSEASGPAATADTRRDILTTPRRSERK
jgi:hypothetical protein